MKFIKKFLTAAEQSAAIEATTDDNKPYLFYNSEDHKVDVPLKRYDAIYKFENFKERYEFNFSYFLTIVYGNLTGNWYDTAKISQKQCTCDQWYGYDGSFDGRGLHGYNGRSVCYYSLDNGETWISAIMSSTGYQYWPDGDVYTVLIKQPQRNDYISGGEWDEETQQYSDVTYTSYQYRWEKLRSMPFKVNLARYNSYSYPADYMTVSIEKLPTYYWE